MRQLQGWAAALLVFGAVGHASAQFNTEALKKMQKKGHEIVAESKEEAGQKPAAASTPAAAGTPSQGTAARTLPATPRGGGPGTAVADNKRIFRFVSTLCLTAGDVLTVERCDPAADNQQWTLDEQGRLVAESGLCLAGNRLVACGAGKVQQWGRDDRGRLANQARQCLQVQGQPPKAGARVMAVTCTAAPSQLWTEASTAPARLGGG